MSDDLFNVSEMIQVLRDTLSNDLTVYDGWIPKSDIYKPIEPSVSVTWGKNNRHVDLNVWASSESKVNDLSRLVMAALMCMKSVGVTVYNILPLDFEINGALGYDWKSIKGSSPIHRILLEIDVKGENENEPGLNQIDHHNGCTVTTQQWENELTIEVKPNDL